jgi:hypothetical protein
MQIANIIYKIYSPPQSAGKNQLQRSREAAFRYDTPSEKSIIIQSLDSLNSHYSRNLLATVAV